MKYTLYVSFICVIITLLSACAAKKTIPLQLTEGEILFQTIEYTTAKADTHYTLLIIKKNKVKTLYLHQRPHFATIRTLFNPVTERIYLQNNQKKIIPCIDTLHRKNLTANNMKALSDTMYWNISAQRYQYTNGDSIFIFTTLKSMSVSPQYVQDVQIIEEYKLFKFPVQIVFLSREKKSFTQLIRIEQKDIADIEFEYNRL
jgi:hypothetical protein